ncbi:hypothetical protein C5E43_15295 [Nocardia cyriacigeorgica]|nr:hypothetical protein C5B73_10500 [Nocardia cyriacigeorgica]PPJ09682.1 hypothetical protein C5E43_15295 [Nocardia cyriacigeorgica]
MGPHSYGAVRTGARLRPRDHDAGVHGDALDIALRDCGIASYAIAGGSLTTDTATPCGLVSRRG